MKKRYGVYVALNVADYFEEKIKEFGSTIIERIPELGPNNEPCYYYIHEIEEGIINPKYEIKEGS